MVSIHRAPIVVYLTIRVLCLTFRFKREDMWSQQHSGNYVIGGMQKTVDPVPELYNAIQRLTTLRKIPFYYTGNAIKIQPCKS